VSEMNQVKRFVSRFFCLHVWDDGNGINKLSRLGKHKFICLRCNKTIYRDSWNIPISWHA